MMIAANIISLTVLFAVPLLLVALGGMFSEHSGVINIALEGMMIIGALFACFTLQAFDQSGFGPAHPQLAMLVAILVAGLTGVIFSFFLGFAAINLKADQTIGGTALNQFAPAFAVVMTWAIQGQGLTTIFIPNWVRITRDTFGLAPVDGPSFWNNLIFKYFYLTTPVAIVLFIAAYIVSGQDQGMAQPEDGGNASRGGSSAASHIVTAVVAALVAAALCLGVGYFALTYGWVSTPTTTSLTNVQSNKSGTGSATAKTGEAADWKTVASEVSGSVVSIQAALSNGTAKGSGAIVSAKGYIVTNNHVISGAQQIQVTLSNGQMYTAQVVGTDTTTDLAVIKLDNPPSDLKAVEFADSDKLAVGEDVMAIGNPLGYDDTATTGIVSALNRPVTVTDDSGSDIVTNAVQIDAAINPGNSGGPTFNAAGQVIGINSSIASTATSSNSAGSIGIGFAIPSNLVKRVANEIIKDGKVKHVALGVTITTGTVEADGVTRAGAKVTAGTSGSAVVSGSPADKAGLKVGDVIVAYDGNAVSSTYSLLGYVRASALNDKVTLTIVRGGKTMDVEVTLDKEESAVNGSGSSNSNNNQNNQNNQNGNGQNGNGNGNGNSNNGNSNNGNGNDSNGYGNNDYGNGGFSDPFGLW